jgi:hypothetical protein
MYYVFMLDPLPVTDAPPEAYIASLGSPRYSANLMNCYHKRFRLGIARYISPGVTIKFQKKSAIKKCLTFVNIKFPQSPWDMRHLRRELVRKLNRAKTTSKKKLIDPKRPELEAEIVALGQSGPLLITQQERERYSEYESQRDCQRF